MSIKWVLLLLPLLTNCKGSFGQDKYLLAGKIGSKLNEIRKVEINKHPF
jgi:hypothetical protein